MKDHQTLHATLGLLPQVHCLAIGAGTETLPDRPNLHRLGRRDDVSRLLPAADFIVSSSAYGEGFSNALAEGMASGLPAITTDIGDARELVGDTGVIGPPRAADRLAAGSKALICGAEGERRERRGRSPRGLGGRFSPARAGAG